MSGFARFVAGAQPGRGRVCDPHRAGAELRDRAMVPLRPEELLLPGHAEELPDFAVRRADRHQRLPRGAAGRRHHLAGGDRAGAHGGRHRQADPPRQRNGPHRRCHRFADRLQPCRCPADRNRHQAHCGGRRPGTADRPVLCDRTAGPVARVGRIRCQDGPGLDALRRQRVTKAHRDNRIRHPDRDQERQLAQKRRGRRALRNAAPRRVAGVRWPDYPGDQALSRGRVHQPGPRQGDRAGLPVFPRTRPGTRRPQPRAGGAAAPDHPRTTVVEPQADSSRSGAFPTR